METLSCPSCAFELNEKSLYCPKCLAQVKCKKCSELLIKDAMGCSTCGTPITKTEAIESQAVNTIEFEQKGNSRKFKTRFTDEVGENLSNVLNIMLTGTALPPSKNTNINKDSKKIDLTGNNDTISDAEIIDDDDDVYIKGIKALFKIEGESVILRDNRLKAKNLKDHYTRMTFLYLYANLKLAGKNAIPRAEVTKLLEKENAYDGNARSWLGNASELDRKDNGDIGLKLPGEQQAEAILKEIADPKIEHKTITSRSSRSKSKKTDDITEDAENTKNGKESSVSSGQKSNKKVGYFSFIKTLKGVGYFKEKKTVSEIVKYCGETRGHHFTSKDVSSALLRLIHDGVLNRAKNSDGQFDYFE